PTARLQRPRPGGAVRPLQPRERARNHGGGDGQRSGRARHAGSRRHHSDDCGPQAAFRRERNRQTWVAMSVWSDPRVGAIRASDESERAFSSALIRIGHSLGWAAPGRGAFGRIVTDSARVVVKPNWVMHANAGPGGVAPLVTSPHLVRAVVEEVLAAT